MSKEPDATVKYSPLKKAPNSEAHLILWERKEVTHDFTAHGLVPIPPKKAPDGCFAEVGHMLNGKLMKRHLCVKPGHWSPAMSQWAGVHTMSGFPLLPAPTAPDIITPRLLRKC